MKMGKFGDLLDTQNQLEHNRDISKVQVLSIDEIKRKRKERIIINVLAAFGDESHDEKMQRVFVVAGIAGSQEEWDALEVNWVKRTNGKIFHASDCESGLEDYKDVPRDECLKLYRDITKMLAESSMIGYGAVMDIQAFRTFFPDTLDGIDIPYYYCFERFLRGLAWLGYLSIPPEKIKFTFHINCRVQHNAADLYDFFCHLPEWEYKYSPYMSEEVSFASSKTVGIQAADLYARELMKHFYNLWENRKRPTRLSFLNLLDSRRFSFAEPYDKMYFEDFRKRLNDFDEKEDNYRKWLQRNLLYDNAGSRIRYIIYLEAVES